MTKEEILAMKPGRELDVLVAKEIFSIEVEWDYAPWDINKQLPKQPYRKGEPRTVLGPTAHAVGNTIYEHSTDISSAWQVVVKLDDDGWYYTIAKFGIPNSPDFIRCNFTKIGIAVVYADVNNSTELPKAICKAALLAKLSQGDELGKKIGGN